MMGIVDDFGRVLVRITVRHPQKSTSAEWEAWIDTGFTGTLMLTREQADALELPRAGAVAGVLADSTQIQFETCPCVIDWMGGSRSIAATICTGRFALIGVGLLEDLLVAINYPARTVSLEQAASDSEKGENH
jgi:clan AA aspartic protease